MRSLISPLLATSCPTAIPRFVITIVVDSFNGKFRTWLSPNVSKEGVEGFLPALTNSDAAPSVVLPSGIIGIGTTLNKMLPRMIFRRIAQPMLVFVPLQGAVSLPASKVHFAPTKCAMWLAASVNRTEALRTRLSWINTSWHQWCLSLTHSGGICGVSKADVSG